MASSDVIQVAPTRFVTIPLGSAVTGLTQSAIRCKIARGVWTLNKHYRMGPDNRVYIDLEGYTKWVLQKA